MIGHVVIILLLSASTVIAASALRGNVTTRDLSEFDNKTAVVFDASFRKSSATGRQVTQPRRLETLDFVPLVCNSKLASAVCTKWSELIGTANVYTKRVTIGCGQCVIMDHAGANITLQDGLDVRGRLIFPDGYKLNMITTMIVVQGQLDMIARKPVDGIPNIKFTMIGNNDGLQFFPMGENKGKCGGETMCTVGKKSITVAGGKVNINGLPSNTPTWVNVIEDSSFNWIMVDESVLNKWGAGSEILITSHTREWNKHQQRTITSVVTSEFPGKVRIWFDRPIVRPTTVRESPDFATEVALLSRNIVFEGGADDTALHGGHMRIMYTPKVAQSIMGVDVRNFGQQGTLGRYPIHFHLCGDVSGSVVAKNTIRQSNQRCLSIHGTNNVEIFQNVAYDVFGHCFFTEDGIETGNRFIENLGAQIKIPQTLLVVDGVPESDSEPAVFWITNPNNHFINNVAAGSQSVGFWIHPFIRGERAHLFPGYNPAFEPLGVFDLNVAHSCGSDGGGFSGAIRTYASNRFHTPKEVARLTRMRVYRNKNKGFMLHKNQNYVVSDSIFADNDLGMDVDRTDGVTFRDSVIIGVSQSYRNLMATQGVAKICRQGQIIGLDMHTWMLNSEYGAVTLDNITISGFDDAASTGCGIMNVRVDPFNLEENQFEQFATFRNIHLEDGVNKINFCLAEDAGIDTVHWVDYDGSFRPPNTAQPTGASTVLSNGPDIMKFIDRTKCTINTNGCYSYCPNTCFRSVRYEIKSTAMDGYLLKACRKTDSQNCSIFQGSRRGPTDPRSFLAHLPVGNSYNLVFLDKSGREVATTSELKEIPVASLCPASSGTFVVDLVAKLP